MYTVVAAIVSSLLMLLLLFVRLFLLSLLYVLITNFPVICSHEDGSVRFWDVSSLNMSPLYTIQTSKFFSGDHEPPEQVDGEDEGWPHLRKVGVYDPFCDDQRLGVQKIYFDAGAKILAVGGHGGQIVVLDVNKEEKNVAIPV